MKWSCVLVSLGLLLARSHVESFSKGAPDSACESMVPGHSGDVQKSPPPYYITPNTTSAFGGERILLRLEANGSDPFKGFLIQARDSSFDSRVGTFFTSTHKTLECSALNDAVTHVDSQEKRIVTVEWEAPSDFEGDVSFWMSIVRDYVTFWARSHSEKVTIQKRDTSGVVPKTSQGGSQTEEPAGSKEPLKGIQKAVEEIYFGCGTIKSCFGIPAGCIDKKSCDAFTSYTKVDESKYEFEAMGPSGGDKYAAVGISADDRMGDDSVVVCASRNSRIELYNTWNQGKSNEAVANKNEGLVLLEGGMADGKQYCRYHRAAVTKFNSVQFDLNDGRYHVMVATGSMNDRGALIYHSRNREATPNLVSLGLTTKLEANPIHFEDIHAALMIIAWVGTASCGMIFARYFKQTWLSYKCCSLDQWFHYHRLFMILTWALTIAGLVMIVLEVMDFRLINHAFIGIASIVLCFIQPFAAMCRPAPTSKSRWVFNWAHWFIGNSAQILGFAAIFLGIDIKFGTTDRNWIKEVMWYILVVFVAFHCLIHLILSILKCVSDRRASRPIDVFPLKDLNDSRIPLQGGEKIREDAPLAGLRKAFLGIYLPINWIATALLVICVIVSKSDIESTLQSWGSPAFWVELEG